MKLVKSLLLGSAAGLVAVAGASAADLGVKKPTAVEYVKTCPTYGAGFFVVPGTTSCLKLIGRVRAEYLINNPTTRAADRNTFRARGYFGYDHRTATEYGLLRTFVRGFFGRDNAIGGAIAGTNASAANAFLEYAFIQFGGLTVGRVTPAFDHGWNPSLTGSGAIGGHSDLAFVNSIGYTFNAGGGFSASVALDSAAERRLNVANLSAAIVGPPAFAAQTQFGQSMPDIVGRLSYDQAWGSLMLAGAVHQIGVTGGAVAAGAYGHASTKYGWAVTGGAKLNVPMLSAGSNIWISGGWAEGASSYSGFGSTATIGSSPLVFSDAALVGATVGVPGRLRLTRTWSIIGGAQVFVTPTIWLALTGHYASHDPAGAANTVRTYSVVGTAGWTPVPGLFFGLDGAYRRANIGRALIGATLPIVPGADRHDFTGRLRVQRDF